MIIAILSILVLMLLRVPVALAVLGGSFLYYLMSPGPAEVAVQRFVSSLESFPLLAVPMFILAGTIMVHGGIARRIIGLANAMVGHQKGGLAQVNVANSLLMGGMTGSSNADAAMDAKLIVPEMRRHGYPRGFSTALTASSGLIASLIPPSIGLILYGLVAQVSVGHLFLAGIVPGVLMALALAVTVRIWVAKAGWGNTADRPQWRGLVRDAKASFWALMLPVILLVGLRLGVFTPTELAAIMVVYCLIIAMAVYREVAIKDLPKIFSEAARTSAVVMFLVGAAGVLGGIMSRERVPQALWNVLSGISDNRWILLALVVLALLVIGSLVESTALLIIMGPLVGSLAGPLGIDPVQLGIMTVLVITIGGITPPIGGVMYTTMAITGATFQEFTKAVWPFIVSLLCVVLLIATIPVLTLGLPGWLL